MLLACGTSPQGRSVRAAARSVVQSPAEDGKLPLDTVDQVASAGAHRQARGEPDELSDGFLSAACGGEFGDAGVGMGEPGTIGWQVLGRRRDEREREGGRARRGRLSCCPRWRRRRHKRCQCKCNCDFHDGQQTDDFNVAQNRPEPAARAANPANQVENPRSGRRGVAVGYPQRAGAGHTTGAKMGRIRGVGRSAA